MQAQDVLVGTVAALLGLMLLAGGALNAPWLMQLGKPRLLTAAIGPAGARLLVAAIGIALIALGVAIGSGWRIDWNPKIQRSESPSAALAG
jgi:hypothetical protein